MVETSKDTFKTADTDTKLYLLFDLCSSIQKDLKNHSVPCETRFKALESRKFKDTAAASIFGFVGGFVAVLGKKILGM